MLPITEMLEEEKKKLSLTEWFWFSEIINKVRTLEEASQKKAKEEERDRILGILEGIRNGYNQSFHPNLRIALQEAITRINN